MRVQSALRPSRIRRYSAGCSAETLSTPESSTGGAERCAKSGDAPWRRWDPDSAKRALTGGISSHRKGLSRAPRRTFLSPASPQLEHQFASVKHTSSAANSESLRYSPNGCFDAMHSAIASSRWITIGSNRRWLCSRSTGYRVSSCNWLPMRKSLIRICAPAVTPADEERIWRLASARAIASVWSQAHQLPCQR